MDLKKGKWRAGDNGSHMRVAKWMLQRHPAAAALTNMPVSEITPDVIQSALKPLWLTTPITARRALNMWENVLDHARARGWYKGENPARWKGLHEHLSPEHHFYDRHHEALPYAEIPEFIQQLRKRQATSVAALALEFLILTAARTSEVLEMEWTEIDYEQRVWTLSPNRTKQKQQHRVPLSDRAWELIEIRMEEGTFDGSSFVFTGHDQNPLSEKSMFWILKRRMSPWAWYTVHGFRSTFSDWAHDTTAFAHETIEACLGHSVIGKVAKAYRRGDSLEKRRELMRMWADYCGGQGVESGGEGDQE
jgi:integrase